MTENYVSDRGSIVATYEPAGPVEIGTYVTEPPSDREKARQAEMAEGGWSAWFSTATPSHPTPGRR